MTKKDLAEALRRRQRGNASIDEVVSRLSDDEIIDCYNRCCSCGRKAIPLDDLDLVINDIHDAHGFIARLDSLDSQGNVHRRECPETRGSAER